MTFRIEALDSEGWAREVATRIEAALPLSGAVVITGGTTVAKVYELFEDHRLWNGLDVMFSDERCVPPDHPDSNFKMATDLFLERSSARVHRMPGELEPAEGALRYHDDIAELISTGPDLAFMGMGADCHVGAIYPGSPALITPNYCAAVARPDGLAGLTLTPSAMLACSSIRLLVTGATKAEAVLRAVRGSEGPSNCPVRALADHPDVTFYLDAAAAALL